MCGAFTHLYPHPNRHTAAEQSGSTGTANCPAVTVGGTGTRANTPAPALNSRHRQSRQ